MALSEAEKSIEDVDLIILIKRISTSSKQGWKNWDLEWKNFHKIALLPAILLEPVYQLQ